MIIEMNLVSVIKNSHGEYIEYRHT